MDPVTLALAKSYTDQRAGIKLRNLLANSSFEIDSNEDGLADHWTISGSFGPGMELVTDAVVGEKAQQRVWTTGAIRQIVSVDPAHICYGSIWFKRTVENTGSAIRLQLNVSGESGTYVTLPNAVTDWSRYSVETAECTELNVGRWSTETGTTIIDGAVLVDLTAAFGPGNEPTKAEMDVLFDDLIPNGWFEGELLLDGPLLFQWLLRLTRANAQAITSLGGGA